jgi:DNA-directed RNA polymerase beta' subunit
MKDLKKFIATTIREYLNENNQLTYKDVFKKQQIDNPYSDVLFSTENSKFVEEIIDIKKLRELNGFSDDEDEIEQTVSYFDDLGMDEDYTVSKKLMNKIVNGIKLSPIVVDDKYKVLDGSHRLAAYSELYYYHSYDFDFDGKLKIYKRISN